MEEKKGSFWKENSTFIIPTVVLILLLAYAIFSSQQGAVVLATPSTAECAKALVSQAETLGGGKKFRLKIVEEGTLEVFHKEKAAALIAPFSPELFSAGALPVAVDAMVVLSNEGANLNQSEIPALEKKGKFFYPPKDLWLFYNYRVGPISKNPRIFFPGSSLGKGAFAFSTWSQSRKTSLKVSPYNGIPPTEGNISILQYPLWYQIFLFTSGDESAKKAGVDLLIKAANQKSYKKSLADLSLFPWVEK